MRDNRQRDTVFDVTYPWALEQRGGSCACREAANQVELLAHRGAQGGKHYLQLLLETVPVPAQAARRKLQLVE